MSEISHGQFVLEKQAASHSPGQETLFLVAVFTTPPPNQWAPHIVTLPQHTWSLAAGKAGS